MKEELKLIDMLKGVKVNEGKIDLYERISEVKKSAREDWLVGLEKNAYEHSERLEDYLNKLTKNVREGGIINYGEVFVLLCAVYTHDIGYRCDDGTIKSEGHPQRSREMILKNWSTYHFDDFPLFKREYPRVAKAVGFVCCGHSNDISLEKIPDRFTDAVFGTNSLDLRKLTALLRIADEADDPYIRYDPSKESIRDSIPLVEIGEETIVWHRDRSAENDPFEFQRLLEEKLMVLESSINYLSQIGAGNRYLVLDPQVTISIPYMAENPVETFVGRQKDLEALHEKTKRRGEGAITGISGTGGIGKTELAKRYAKTYKKEYPGGVFWVSLKGSTWRKEAEKLIGAVFENEKFSKTFPDNQSAKDYILKNILVRKDSLLIIDNAREGDDIIKSECVVLVTTRNKSAFGSMPWNAIHELYGLPVDDGLDLLSGFIGMQRINMDCEGASRIVEILGGMPLAIDIAAKHLSDVPDLSFPGYIGRINNKIDELQIEGDSDKDVRSSLELSLEQLKSRANGKDLLLLFESAAVCAESGFTSRTLVETAGFDTVADNKIQDLVAKLYQRSLLEFNADSNRYSMHPLLRQMADNRLHDHPDGENKFKFNHCHVFLHYCESHDNDLDSLLTEKDNIWQALIQAGQLDGAEDLRKRFLKHLGKPYWDLIERKQYNEAFNYLTAINLININDIGEVRALITLLDPLFKNLSKLNPIFQSGVLNSMGIAHENLSEYQKAIEMYEGRLAITRRMGDVRGEGITLNNIGLAYADLSKYQKALDFYVTALEINRRIGDLHSKGSVLGNMGLAYLQFGEYQKAIGYYEDALKIHRRIGDNHGEGSVLGNMGLAYANLGKYQKAVKLYEERLTIARRIGDMRGEENTLGNMGSVYMQRGKYCEAIDLYEDALEIARRIGDMRGEENTLGNMGLVYAALGEFQKAIGYYEDALKIAHCIGNVCGKGNAFGNMGLAYAAFGEHQNAIDLYEKQLVIVRHIGDIRGEGIAIGSIGLAYANLGKYQKAIGFYEDALKIHRRIGDVYSEGDTLGNMGLAYATLGKYQNAIGLYEKQLVIVRHIGDIRGEGSALGNLGLAYADLGEKERAYQCLNRSKQIFEKLGLEHMLLELNEIEKLIDSKFE